MRVATRRLATCVAGAAVLLALMSSEGLAQGDDERLKELELLIEEQRARMVAQQILLEDLQREVAVLAENAGAAPAEPSGAISLGDERVKLALYGQVNRGVLYYDDGNEEDIRHVDNDASSTRIGFNGSIEIADDMKIGTTIEVQFESNSTADINQADNTAVGPNNFTQRKLELFLDSERFGKLSLGQGQTASDDSANSNLSGTGLVGSSAVADLAGGLDFAVSGTGALSGTTVSDVFDNLDGLGRDDRARYDTPNFGGLTLSTSVVDGGEVDLALHYDTKFPGLNVEGKVGYANQSGTRTFPEEIVTGSLSALHDSGFNVTFAAGVGDDDSGGDDAGFWYGKLGYIALLFPIGTSHVSIDYGEYDDGLGDQGTARGAQFVQRFKDWGAEVYAGYRNYDLDRPGAPVDDIDAVLAGARVKF